MTIDRNLIRSYFDELKIATHIDDDGDMVVIQSADEDFGHDVVIFVFVNNNRLSYAAGAREYRPEGDLLMQCSFLLDEEVSKEYIVENCIKMVLGTIWRGFCDLEKEEA